MAEELDEGVELDEDKGVELDEEPGFGILFEATK